MIRTDVLGELPRNMPGGSNDELGSRSRRLETVLSKVKEKWGQLTDDDLAQINGNCEQLEGKIQSRYGLAKDKVKGDVDTWMNGLK
jgi:uncharacterized protein YjbJ (UPF0337 family)